MTEEVVRNPTVQVRHQRLSARSAHSGVCSGFSRLAPWTLIPYYKISHPLAETFGILLPLQPPWPVLTEWRLSAPVFQV